MWNRGLLVCDILANRLSTNYKAVFCNEMPQISQLKNLILMCWGVWGPVHCFAWGGGGGGRASNILKTTLETTYIVPWKDCKCSSINTTMVPSDTKQWKSESAMKRGVWNISMDQFEGSCPEWRVVKQVKLNNKVMSQKKYIVLNFLWDFCK